MSRLLKIGLFTILVAHLISADELPACQATDFHYEYTECDSEGGRWRVSVPKPNSCVGGAPNAPVRGKGCEFTCETGTFLDLQNDQECHPCSAGTYSLGGGERFEDWNHMPLGFTVQKESFTGSGLLRGLAGLGDKTDVNCTKSGWLPQGNYIASLRGPCSAVLQYSANLVQAGTVEFTYQYTDDDSIFHFQVQNDQCQTIGDSSANKWPQLTDEGEWKKMTIHLKSGLNVMTWRSMSVGGDSSSFKKPIMIKSIEITGVAFTSVCTKCRPGTHSAEGASICVECPSNTYSNRGASDCTSCDSKTEYAPSGSEKCKPRPACTENDYFEYQTPCKEKVTRKTYKWTEPMVCREEHQDSVKLPDMGPDEECPPCNPGMELLNGTCRFCPENHHSDGNGACAPCTASTAPTKALEYKWWNSLPDQANVTTSCLSMDDRGCLSEAGWVMQMDHVRTAKGQSDDAYLVMSLHVGGFQGEEQVVQGKPVEIASIEVVLELDCAADCTLFFMQLYHKERGQSPTRGTTVVKTWLKKTARQSFKHIITKTEPVTFSWAFQKATYDVGSLDGPDEEENHSSRTNRANDFAKIYSVKVTNTIDGGASVCKDCPRGVDQEGCIPCPEGSYIDPNSTSCKSCEGNTIVRGQHSWGEDSCKPCGQGLVAQGHKKCVTSCKYRAQSGRQFDFTGLSGIHDVTGARLFTASGTQYYHYFKISLCGGSEDFPMVTCADNITASQGHLDFGEKVKSIICRTTIIPPSAGEKQVNMAAQPDSLGDNLVSITDNDTSTATMKMMEEHGFKSEDTSMDIHFTYISEVATSACPKGRKTIITLRCDPTQKENGTIELPPKCPDGTCDGCDFHFLWRTMKACPVCKDDDFEVVKGECKGGEQEIHFIPPKHCILQDASKLTKKQTCHLLSVLPMWLVVAIGFIVGLGIVLFFVTIYCWKKNRKLEYKYHKLVTGKGDQDGELPAAETCGFDDDEEDEQFDSVQFTSEGKGKKFFNKIKNIGKKDNPFESIALDEKMALT